MSTSNSKKLGNLSAKINEAILDSLALENQMDEFTSMRRLWERKITQPLRDAADFIEMIEKRKGELNLK